MHGPRMRAETVSRSLGAFEPRPVQPNKPVLFAFTAALSAGDLTAAAACFAREACLVTQDGTAIHGRREIASVLAQLIARSTEIEIEQVVVRRAGEVALAAGRWTMRSDGPEGSHFVQVAEPTVVLRWIEGNWKIAIIAPWD